MKQKALSHCPAFASPLLLLVMGTVLAVLVVPTWHFASAMRGNVGMSVALHTILECLFVAGAIATFSVAWYSPRGEYRLRLILTACLCLPIGIFDLLHFLTYPGMPDILASSHQALSFYFVRIARCVLPFTLLALVLTPLDIFVPTRQRLALLGATVVVILLCVPLGLSIAPDLAQILTETAHLRTVTVALFLSIAWLAHRRIGLDRPNATYLLYAALLGAIAQACLIPGQSDMGISTPLKLLGHILDDLTMAILFIAVYGEAVHIPYDQLKQAHATACLDMQRIDTILRSTADGMLVIDAQRRVLFANPVACRLLGWAEDEPSGTPLIEMLAVLNGTGATFVADIEACLCQGHANTGIYHIPTASADALGHDIRTIEHAVSPVACPEGGIAGAVLVLRNITSQWQFQRQQLAAANYARNLFETSPDPMISIGSDGIIADVNCAAEIATGVGRDKLVGAYFVSRFTDPAGARIGLQRALGGEIVRDLDLALARTGGGILQVSCNIAPQCDTGGVRGAIAVVRDVTDLRQAELQLQFQANCDALTALPNRRHFREHIDQTLIDIHALGNNRTVAVMVVDLDDFRDVNDTQGHSAGDELLKIIATRLSDTLYNLGIIARIGGDEFGVFLTEGTKKPGIQGVVDSILATVAQPLVIGDREITINCSIGVSTHPLDPGDAAVLLKNADTAMYCAKKNGKNQCQFFQPEMNAAVWRRVDLAHHLRSALAREELSLHYQPQVHLQSAEVVGVEALLRWNSAELGFVSPTEFIPVAEDTGLILPIGAWVLEEACRQAARWHTDSGTNLGVAVNLSARQFRDEGLVALVTKALAATGLPPHLLELELTEGMLMRDAARAAETMARLKSTGASLSIDDFGTGYSSLAYLKRFPLDKLKIDRSFVTDIPGDANDIAIVHSILALAHGLGLEVIAEGAETKAQITFLRTHGCEVVQGYYVSRPLPAADVPTFLARWQQEQSSALADWKEGAL